MKSLDDSCEKYLEKVLLVETHYGWGWSFPENINKISSNKDMEAIPNFKIRLLEFFKENENDRRGGNGVIEDNTCKYNGCKIVFSTRYSGIFNFDNDFPECNISIYANENDKENNIEKYVIGWGLIKSGEV